MLTMCIECGGKVSDKAFMCPHCGFPMAKAEELRKVVAKKSKMRRPNGSGTIVKLSGNRRKPFQVRICTVDENGYKRVKVLGSFEDRIRAEIALGKYNEYPYDLDLRKLTFTEVYEHWYTKKYGHPPSEKVSEKRSSEYTTRAAYKKCMSLHGLTFSKIRTHEMQKILDDKGLSHASTEHAILLLKNMGKHALEFDMIMKNYAEFLKINKADDDIHGVPFTEEELALLWKHEDTPFVDTILIYCYSGWRLNELAKMPLENIDLKNQTFIGGLKTRFSKNRIVPIHSKIFPLVKRRYAIAFKSLIYHDGIADISENKYREYFTKALRCCGIDDTHTPNDCRHTCNTLLDNADVNRVAKYRIMGHVGKDINERVYTHKNIEQLRKAIEGMWVPQRA